MKLIILALFLCCCASEKQQERNMNNERLEVATILKGDGDDHIICGVSIKYNSCFCFTFTSGRLRSTTWAPDKICADYSFYITLPER